MRPILFSALFGAPLWILPLSAAWSAGSTPVTVSAMDPQCFTIKVIDDQTGRGVPLVELRTVNEIAFFTDSNGVVAFHEPGLMNRKVFFHIKSHGYDYPADGFGYHGTTLRTVEGGSATVRIKRINIAERLYRITGAGIYRDSLLAGVPVPTREPLIDGGVLGQDSVLNAVYNGKLYWFWGDTNRADYPLGNFSTTGATSDLPDSGGLDPSAGVNLSYFVGNDGFVRPMAPIPGPGPCWVSGLVALRDTTGKERLLAAYSKVRGDMSTHRRGLLQWNDTKQQFEEVTQFPVDTPLYPRGNPFVYEGYIYFADCYPLTRVPDDPDKLRDLSAYEAYTCLKAETSLSQMELDRAADGTLRYAWKKNTPAVQKDDQERLVRAGKAKPEELLIQLRDAETGKPVHAQTGSVYWNEYRKRWLLIAVESHGTSMVGEIWYAEADTPVGPWTYARKVVTHDTYDFYNPKQHPEFDQQGGKTIYFEGTYTNTFSGVKHPTPRYDYNQIMYRLDLTDPRLILPAPVYETTAADGTPHFAAPQPVGEPASRIAFFAPDRPKPGLIPLYAGDRGALLTLPPAGAGAAPVFFVLSPEASDHPAAAAPLYDDVDNQSGRHSYSLSANPAGPGFTRQPHPIGYVWPNPGPAHLDNP